MTDIDNVIFKQLTANEVLIATVRQLQSDLAASRETCMAIIRAREIDMAVEFKRGQEVMREAAAKVVQDHEEAIMTHNNERFLQPRRNGNLLGLAFVDAILRLRRS